MENEQAKTVYTQHKKTEGCTAKPQIGFFVFLGLVAVIMVSYFVFFKKG